MAELNPAVQKKLEERARAKVDRLFLANEVLGYDFSEETHKELFDTYPQFKENVAWAGQFKGQQDTLVLWPRGHYKTTAVVVLVIQAILINPDIRVLLMQGTVKVTKTLLKQIASHFDGTASNSRLKELFPEFCGVKGEDGEWKFGKKLIGLTAEQFTTPARVKKQLAQATVTVASPNSVKTGQHYDLGIFDDLVNDKNYKNPDQLAKVEEDFAMARPLIDPGCPRFVSGTRYAFGDLYENIMRQNTNGEWAVSLKTCWLDGSNPASGVRFPERTTKDGRTLGFTKEGLLRIMRETPDIYASQYLNQPVLASKQILNEQMLLAAVVAKDDTPALSQSVLFIDLASEGLHPDDSVIIAGKVDTAGRMYVVDIRGGQFTVSALAMNVIEMAVRHRPIKVLIEKTASAQYFVAYLLTVCRDKKVSLAIDYIKVDNTADAKNIRVQAMAGHVRNKRLFFFPSLPCWDKFVEQASQFPKGRYGHDDYPDTIALMCQEFSKSYVGLAPPRPVSSNPMIAALSREPAMQGISPQEEYSPEESMGSDFAC